ncbi:MAG: arylsulfatase [Verrucomicrobia bacterium]|nr:MAG: arylsulfatase [Verrucomicrobiota bacterium]
MKQPNIILIICDQMRGDALGADGNRHIQTPNLDFLASRGTRFSHAYSAVPSCIPTRAALWTGQSQWHTGVLGMGRGQGPIPDDFPHTLAGELTKGGYRTHLVGKGHFNPQRAAMGFESMELDESGRMPDSNHRTWFAKNAPDGVTPDDHGVAFNSWHARPWHTEERLHPTYWTMTRALEFFKSHDQERPAFLNISFARPHSPYVPPEYYFEMYDRANLPAPHMGEWSEMHDDPGTAVDPNAWRGKMTSDQIRRARAGYYGEISFIDMQIGRLINWMQRERAEQFSNTWFLFTSDHGDMQGDHNLWRKTYAYEGSARVPFLVVPPTSLRGSQRPSADEVVELRDIMPTLLDAAGLSIPGSVDGRSVLPLLTGPTPDWREYIHGEHCTCYSEEQEMQYVTDGKRKFIWLPRIGREQFFDLERDPGETCDLIDDPAAQDEIHKWRGYLVRELADRDCGWVKNGRPFCPGDDPLVSPFKDTRWQGRSR